MRNLGSLVSSLVLILFSFSLLAQPSMDVNARPTGSVKGVVRTVSEEVVEYATISIFKASDNSLVTGGITGADGSFDIGDLKFGKYTAEISFVGFDKNLIENIVLTPSEPVFDLGGVTIEASTKSINEVEVVANRPQVEYKIDKKIVSVGADITATGGTAIDVLENVPSIQTDIEGNISLRGSSNFTVYIDGRPSILGSEALQQIPASAIENIEIITNPSAKYDAEGTAGIINVVMKKRKGQGINGIINTSVGSNGEYGTDLLLNFRAERFNLYTGLDYNKRTRDMEATSYEKTWFTEHTDTLYKWSNREIDNQRGGYGAKLGFDYYIDDNTTISVSGEYSLRNRDRNSLSSRKELFRDTITNYVTESFNNSSTNNYELNIDFVRKFNEEGHELTSSFQYDGETTGIRDEGLNEYLEVNNIRTPTNTYKIADENPEFEVRFKLDYTNPFSEYGKIEAGFQYEGDYSHYNYQFQELVEGNTYVNIDSLSQELDINRGVYSLYGLYANRAFWDIDYQLGLRLEYTDREVIADQSYPVKRPDFFPSVHFSKSINDKNQIMANYSRRIRRPREWSLNPITRFWDTESSRKGNPSLEPEYSNSYEINYQYSFNRSFVALETYHRHSTNLIERNTTVLSDGRKLMTDLNVGESFSTGVELMGNLSLNNTFVFNASYSIYNYKLNSPNRAIDIDNETFSWRSRINVTYNTPWKGRVQLNGFMTGASITAQGERDGFFVTNFGYRQDFWDRKLTATMQVRDVFQSMNFGGTTYLDQSIIENTFSRESPMYSLTLSLKINNYKTKERNGPGGEDSGGFETGGGGDDMF